MRLRSSWQAIALDLAVEVPEADSQKLGRLGLVACARHEGLTDMFFLQFGQGLSLLVRRGLLQGKGIGADMRRQFSKGLSATTVLCRSSSLNPLQ